VIGPGLLNAQESFAARLANIATLVENYAPLAGRFQPPDRRERADQLAFWIAHAEIAAPAASAASVTAIPAIVSLLLPFIASLPYQVWPYQVWRSYFFRRGIGPGMMNRVNNTIV
jgi:hypothetical protein